MTIEEIIAEIRYNQEAIRRAEARIASRKESIEEYEDTLLSLGVQLVPSASPDVGEPLTIEELKSETWYLPSCTVEDYAAFLHYGIPVYSSSWLQDFVYFSGCIFDEGEVARMIKDSGDRAHIRRMGNKFYWESDLK